MNRKLMSGALTASIIAGGLIIGPATGSSASQNGQGGAPAHVFYIMMENHGYDEIIGNTADAPYINSLAASNGLATNYYGVTHPSLPNYLAAVSGSFQGIWDDCKAGASIKCAPQEFIPSAGDGTAGSYLTQAEIDSASATPHMFNGQNIVDQVEASGRTWRAYMQSIPSAGSTVEYAPVVNGTTVKLYAQKHDPFMYFSDINYPGSARLQNIVPFDGFQQDLASGNVPNFVWISPDQCHDMHGISPSQANLIGLPSCGYPNSGLDHGAIQLGDAFLKSTVTAITQSPVWQNGNSRIVITWDEDDYTGFTGCCQSPTGANSVVLGGAHVPTIVLSSSNQGHMVSAIPSNHYTLLATIESMWHLGCLAETCNIPAQDQLQSLFVG